MQIHPSGHTQDWYRWLGKENMQLEEKQTYMAWIRQHSRLVHFSSIMVGSRDPCISSKASWKGKQRYAQEP